MGIYTILDDIKVDEAIDNDLKLIVDRVTSALTVRTIILGGGFGRGEGSVLINQEGIQPVNDYDLFIIVSDDDQTDLRPLSKEIAGEIGIRLLDLIPIKYSALGTLPATQFNYDLRYGGRLLWGENILDLIPEYKEGSINHESGKTLLLNRLICAIEAFSERFIQKGMTMKERFFLANQTGKVVSACVEALLIRKSKYHHSYQRRQEIFETEFSERVRLCWLNKQATQFKLRPTESLDFDPVAYWEGAIHEYIEIIGEHLVPTSGSPRNDLWKLLKKDKNKDHITNNPVERIELMLLLYRGASFLAKRSILSKARNEIENILEAPLPNAQWETLRERTACLWHEMYH